MEILIDPGHGGKDPGAQGQTLKEKEINLAIANHIVRFLSEYNVSASLTRNGDDFVSLQDRVKKASRNTSLFISIHCNGSIVKSANGFESYALKGSKKSQEIQQIIHNELSPFFPKDRGIKSNNFYLLRKTPCPAVLLEYGFITNKNDESLLQSDAFVESIALATSVGIACALNLTWNENMFKVISDGKTLGSWSNQENIINKVIESISSGSNKVTIERL